MPRGRRPDRISWRRHQRRQPCHQVQRLQHHVGRAIPVRGLERIAHLARRRQRQTLAGHRRAAQVAAQPFELAALVRRDGHPGMQREPARAHGTARVTRLLRRPGRQQTENFSRALDRVTAIQAALSQDAGTSVVFSKKGFGSFGPHSQGKNAVYLGDVRTLWRVRVHVSRGEDQCHTRRSMAALVIGGGVMADLFRCAVLVDSKANTLHGQLHCICRRCAREQSDRLRNDAALPGFHSAKQTSGLMQSFAADRC